MMSGLLDFDDAILTLIMSRLGGRALGKLGCTCSRLRSLCSTEWDHRRVRMLWWRLTVRAMAHSAAHKIEAVSEQRFCWSCYMSLDSVLQQETAHQCASCKQLACSTCADQAAAAAGQVAAAAGQVAAAAAASGDYRCNECTQNSVAITAWFFEGRYR